MSKDIEWYAASDDVRCQGPYESELDAWTALRLAPDIIARTGRPHAPGAYVFPQKAGEPFPVPGLRVGSPPRKLYPTREAVEKRVKQLLEETMSREILDRAAEALQVEDTAYVSFPKLRIRVVQAFARRDFSEATLDVLLRIVTKED